MAMTPKEMIEVLQHFEAGGKVEFRSRVDSDFFVWRDVFSPSWDFNNYDYRRKPKPLELWVKVPSDSVVCFGYFSESDAEYHAKGMGRTVHMREVVDDD